MGVPVDSPDFDELTWKQPYWITSVVNARLRETFAEEDVPQAAVLLSALVGEDPGGDPELSDLVSCRIMLAAIKVSEGDANKLALWVQAAREDPRDVIAAAEYRRQLQGEGEAAVQADLGEYLVWVAGDSAAYRN